VNSLNYISIQIGEIVFFIHLDKNSSVDMINQFNLNTKNLQISNIISDKLNEWSIFLSYKNSKIYLSTLYDDKNTISIGKCITNYDSTKNEDNAEEENESEEEEENCESEEKESEKEIESEDIKNGNTDNENTECFSKNLKPKIEEYIDKIINERVKLNNEKVAKIKKEYDNKFEMIQKDIELQEKENEKLEKDVKNILALISDLQKLNHEADEKENTNENNKQYANKNLMFKNDIMNIMQYNNLRQLNQMKMMNQYNMMNPDNFFINSQMPMNDPRLSQLFNQNRNMLNQGNFYFKKINNNNEFH
jgi:chemotaxis protein histidine kinase CheA